MINYIPRLEWNIVPNEGIFTLNSNQITSFSNPSLVAIGMIVVHAFVPEGTKITAIVGNTVTMDNDATDSGNEDFTVINRLDFDYPPAKDTDEQIEPKETVSESVNGTRQIQINGAIARRDMTFSFISNAIRTRFKNEFYFTWAMYGKGFRFYQSKSEPDFVEYELDKLDWNQERILPKEYNFLYQIPLRVRRKVL